MFLIHRELQEITAILQKCLKGIVFFCLVSAGLASDQSQVFSQETTTSTDYTLYQIKLVQIERLLQSGPALDEETRYDVKSLVQDAVLLVDEKLYAIAVDYLDTVIDILENPVVPATGPDQNFYTPSRIQYDLSVFSGSEFWRQQFGLVYGDSDSTIKDEETNPHAGTRLYLEFSKGENIQSQMQLELKGSKEYNSASVYLEHYHTFSDLFRGVFKSTVEKTAYKTNKAFSYLDNSLQAGIYFQPANRLVFALNDEFELRRYNSESDYFSNYKQNQLDLSGETSLENIGKIKLGVETRFRKYGIDNNRDYNENALYAQLWPDLYSRFSLTDIFQYRTRHYVNGYVDSLFTNNFDEFYNLADLRYTLFGDTRLRCQFEVESRTYETLTASIPDYLDYNLEPGVETGIGDFLTLQFGYRFRNKLHNVGGEVDGSVQIEDFYSHGPVFTLDMIMTNGFLASISNSYQAQRYPNYAGYDESGLSLYSNRNINSVFFYLTWSMSTSLELNAMGMFDYDADQDISGANTISNLLNFELLYKF